MECKKCKEKLDSSYAYWDESGYGYSAKIIKCPKCGAIQYLKVIEDRCLDVNNDKRFYEYERMM